MAKEKVERPWLNLRIAKKSVLRCKNTDLIVDKICESRTWGSVFLEIGGCSYWLSLNVSPKRLTVERAVNKALRTHASTHVVMEVTRSRLMRAWGYSRKDNARGYIRLRAKDPDSMVLLIQAEAYPFHPTDELTLYLSNDQAHGWKGGYYSFPFKKSQERNAAFASTDGMHELSKHLRHCMDVHGAFYLPESD